MSHSSTLAEFVRERSLFWPVLDSRLQGQAVLGPTVSQGLSPAPNCPSTPAEELLLARALTLVNSLDLVQLPPLSNHCTEWLSSYYSDASRVNAFALRVPLEAALFPDESVVPTSPEFLAVELARADHDSANAPLALEAVLRGATDPRGFARYVLAQYADDFLVEGSALCRSVLGNYGPIQSAVFEILMDEYGRGQFLAKHSTLYERLLSTASLSAEPGVHRWCALASSLNVPNLLHRFCSNHRLLFRMFGMIAFAETAYAHYCRKVAALLREIFGTEVDTEYFDEHAIVDRKHSSIAVEQVALPLARLHGPLATGEMLAGMQAFRQAVARNEADILLQLRFLQSAEPFRAEARGAREIELRESSEQAPSSVTNQPTLMFCHSGSCALEFGPDLALTLVSGQALRVPARLQFAISARGHATVALQRAE